MITSLFFVCFCLNLTCGPHRIKHHLQLVHVMYSAIWWEDKVLVVPVCNRVIKSCEFRYLTSVTNLSDSFCY